MLSMKQASELVAKGQSSQSVELASQALDPDNQYARDEERSKKLELVEHTETL